MRYDRLGQRLRTWVEAGLISAEQAQAIRSHEEAAAHGERRGLVVQTLASVGAIVAGLGVILFFAANWDAIPRPTRVAALLATIAAAYGLGYLLRFARGTRPVVGEALLFLGTIAFGASIFLVGQMYHVQAHDPFAFLLWSAAALPVAAVVRSRSIAALGLLTLSAWVIHEAVDVADDEALGYVPTLLALYGAALYGFGTAFGERLGAIFAGPMRALGAVFLPAGVFVFTFQGFIEEIADREALSGRIELGLGALTLLALAGAGALALDRTRPTARWEALGLAASVAVVVASILFASGEDPLVLPLLANLVLAALALGAILVGYASEEGWLVNLGIALVGIDVFARYFDLFWDLLPRSFVFLGAGVLLLALAWLLERQRGRLIARMEAP
jgi:uncharacterized membrane protein